MSKTRNISKPRNVSKPRNIEIEAIEIRIVQFAEIGAGEINKLMFK